MVQIIPRLDIGGNIGSAFGGGLGQALQEQAQLANQRSSIQNASMMAQQIYANPSLSPQQKQIALYQAFAGHPEIASRLGQELNQLERLQMPRVEPLNKFSPLPPEIQQVESNFLSDPNIQSLPAEDWYAEGVRRGIPPGEMDRLTKIKLEQEKGQTKERAERFKIHESTKDISKKISSDAEASEKRIRSFDVMERALKSGKLNPKKFSNFLANLAAGSSFEGLLRSPESEEFKAASFNIYEGMKNTFGARLSDADLRLAATKVPDLSKSEEANKKIIDFWKFFDELNIKKKKIAQEITRENKGFRPIDFEDQVDEELNKRYGKQAEKVVKEAADAQVKKGTPITPEIVDKYLDLTNNDPVKAKELAMKDGYEF